MRRTLLPALGAGLLALCLAACEEAPPPEPAARAGAGAGPRARAGAAAPRRARPAPAPSAEPSEVSRDLARYYARVQADLLDQGFLRGDGGGPDAPFTDTMLARDFVEIALFDEYADGTLAGARAARAGCAAGRRPIRMEIELGASIPAAERATDRAAIAAYAARLSRLTGLPILQVAEGGNFHVAILSEDERRAFGPQLRDLVPGISESSVRTVVNLPRSTYCLVFAFSGGEAGAYDRAVVVIRAELPDLLRSGLHPRGDRAGPGPAQRFAHGAAHDLLGHRRVRAAHAPRRAAAADPLRRPPLDRHDGRGGRPRSSAQIAAELMEGRPA